MSSDWEITSTSRLVRTVHNAATSERSWSSTDNLQGGATSADPYNPDRPGFPGFIDYFHRWPNYPSASPVTGLWPGNPGWHVRRECEAVNNFIIHTDAWILNADGRVRAFPDYGLSAICETVCEFTVNSPVTMFVGGNLTHGTASLVGPGVNISLAAGESFYDESMLLAAGDYTVTLHVEASLATPLTTMTNLAPWAAHMEGVRYARHAGRLWIAPAP